MPKAFGISIANRLGEFLGDILTNGIPKSVKNESSGTDDARKIALWNSPTLFSSTKCLHYLFEHAAQISPEKTAINAWNGSMTYHELNCLSTSLSQMLMSLGIGPGTFVPIVFEKSCWAPVAMLGVLKAGGAFVPLDPTHPEPRLQGLLADLGATILLTSQLYEDKLKPLIPHVLVVSSTALQIAMGDNAVVACHPSIRPTDPVFVLFTSGSTGHPKGIVHEHGSMAAHMIALGQEIGYGGVRTLQFSAYTWDIAVIDTFTTLAFNGCLCIPSEQDRQFDITRAMNEMQVDLAILTPSFASLLHPGAITTLRKLILCGEALQEDQMQRWADNISLFQVYGPAEVGICTLTKLAFHDQAKTVGKALNSRCVLVDPEDHNKLVPIGATGELVVSGPSIARAYLNNEEKTLSSFIKDPPWAALLEMDYRRFYKTGDLLKYNVDTFDGALDFVGRSDNQIKRHGQRIDLGEIEHHLASVPNVAMSLLVAPKEGCFRDDLVAVVQVSAREPALSSDASLIVLPSEILTYEILISELADRVPRYMLPSALITVASLPLTKSMKLERRKVAMWVAAMETRPLQDLFFSRESQRLELSHAEDTAKTISVKVADLVGGQDLNYHGVLAGHDLNLQRVGLSSVQLISLYNYLQQRFSVKVPLSMVSSSKTTVRHLAAFIDDSNMPTMPTHNELSRTNVLARARELTTDLMYQIEMHQMKELNIFLTGSTGFLGSEVLRQLLQIPRVKVYNLVRASDEQEAMDRIIERAVSHGWWDSVYLSRLVAWPGDMACSNLGLDPHALSSFGASSDLEKDSGWVKEQQPRINAIIHLGANLNHSLDLSTVAPANVSSTLDLLRLAALSNIDNSKYPCPSFSHSQKGQPDHCKSGINSFTYISGGLQISPHPDDDAELSDRASTATGYDQSKLIAELLVKQSAPHPYFSQAVAMRVVKMGYIIADATGRMKPNPRDSLWRLVKACGEIGAYNVEECAEGRWLYVAGVDEVARSIVHGGAMVPEGGREGTCEVVKQLSGLPLADFWDVVGQVLGVDLMPLRYAEWLVSIQEAVAKQAEEHPLFPILHFLEKGVDGRSAGGHDGEVVHGRSHGVIAAMDAPADVDMREVKRMRKVVAANVRSLVDMGFLELWSDGDRCRST